jgi:hypothetical protein
MEQTTIQRIFLTLYNTEFFRLCGDHHIHYPVEKGRYSASSYLIEDELFLTINARNLNLCQDMGTVMKWAREDKIKYEEVIIFKNDDDS